MEQKQQKTTLQINQRTQIQPNQGAAIQTGQEHIEKVKQMYQTFENYLMRKGILLAKDTGIGYWGVTNTQDLHELFEKIELHNHKNFLDLGSGDGRAVLMAALFGVNATGVEADDWLMNCALDIKRKLDLPHFEKVKFLKDDFMKMDVSKYDIIYINPDKPFHRGLEQKLGRELQGRLVVHGYEFLPSALQKEKELTINGEKFSLFTRV